MTELGEVLVNNDLLTGLDFTTEIPVIGKNINPDTNRTARRQERAIKKYWRDFGYKVPTKIIHHKGDRFWGIRSNLVNGLPRGFRP